MIQKKGNLNKTGTSYEDFYFDYYTFLFLVEIRRGTRQVQGPSRVAFMTFDKPPTKRLRQHFMIDQYSEAPYLAHVWHYKDDFRRFVF